MRRLVVALSLLLAVPAFAQPPGATPPGVPAGPPGPQAQPPGPPRPGVARAQKIKQRIRERRAFELTDALDLGPRPADRDRAHR